MDVAPALDVRLQLLQRQMVQYGALLGRKAQVEMRCRTAQLVVVEVRGGGGRLGGVVVRTARWELDDGQ